MYRMTPESAPNLIGAKSGAKSGAPSTRSPFVLLRELLGDAAPGQSPISLAVGEPQHPIPPFVGSVIAAHVAEFGRYPMNRGLEEFTAAAGQWLDRRYKLPRRVDPAADILGLNGTREGLFLAGIAARNYAASHAVKRAKPEAKPGAKSGLGPAVLIPNPFYAAYSAGAIAADCEPVYLPATAATGFLPDLDALDDELLARTVAFYLASPSNPQGAVADRAYLEKLTALARQFGFLILSDECYCEIYSDRAPAGMLEAAGADFANVVVFHSLSKRSSLPGLRVAIAAYGDEKHVEVNRRLYREKFDLADQIIGGRYNYRRPAGGFFLWLDVSAYGGSEAVTQRLWREAGLRVVPGRYLAQEQADGSNPGADYIRVAMVQDKAITADALHRLVAVLG